MKILGFSHGGHDASYAILEDGKIVIHEELERLNRIKMTNEDVIKYYTDNIGSLDDFDYIGYFPHGSGTTGFGHLDAPNYSHEFLNYWLENVEYIDGEGWKATAKENVVEKIIEVGHHEAHASNAFYGTDWNESLIFSIDGGGSDRTKEDSMLYWSAFTVWHGVGNNLTQIYTENSPSIGIMWDAAVGRIFNYPKGKEGTVMAMSALGEPSWFGEKAKHQLLHYEMDAFSNITDEKEMFNAAATLQSTTEKYVEDKILEFLNMEEFRHIKNICVTGGVSLNSVMMGHLKRSLPVDNIYVPPVPYDAGLSMGVAQYIYHVVLGNPRTHDISYRTPFLGREYSIEEIESAINEFGPHLKKYSVDHDFVINELQNKKIVSIFSGKSESGRRALGNRSILADPRSEDIKQILNEKIKHREWFRPFAPSILTEHQSDWFETAVDSPYMSFCSILRQEKRELVPGIVHADGSARLQTVNEELNPFYYGFIKKWYEITGLPLILNTSFNDNEPIVETPADALRCFNNTEIDYLYFADHGILLGKTPISGKFNDHLFDKHGNEIPRSKIFVVQFYSSADDVPHGPISEEINRRYCEKFGYSYLVDKNEEKIRSSLADKTVVYHRRHPTWYKPRLILDVINEHDPEYIVFLDADCVILDHERPLETIIDTDANLLFTTDIGGHSDVNGGFFIIKNNDFAKLFLNLWMYSPHFYDPEKYMPGLVQQSEYPPAYFEIGFWWDQSCITLMLRNMPYIKKNTKIIHNTEVNAQYASEHTDRPDQKVFILHAFSYGDHQYRGIDVQYEKLFGEKFNFS